MGAEEGEEGTDGGFQYVARKSRTNRKRRKGRETTTTGSEEVEISLRRIKDAIAAKKTLLVTGDVGEKIKSLLGRVFSSAEGTETAGVEVPASVLMLGLGSVRNSRAAQLQLAFLLLVREELERCLESQSKDRQALIKVTAFDPVFDDVDRSVLASFDIETLDANLQGRHTFQQATFVYMPHCTWTLYENLLRANWTQDRLSQLWLCCNALHRYSSKKDSNQATPCIHRLGESMQQSKVPGRQDIDSQSGLPPFHCTAQCPICKSTICPHCPHPTTMH